MNETTDGIILGLTAGFIVLAIVLVSVFVHRLTRNRKIAYNEFLLRRRDNFPLGDLDLDE
jgi:hypothetical protein